MADVIEVIHKINYEVNDAALQNLTDVIKSQIVQLSRLSTQMTGLQQQINSTGQTETAQLEKLTTQLARIQREITQAAKTTQTGIKALYSSIKTENSGLHDSMKGFASELIGGLLSFKLSGKESVKTIAEVGTTAAQAVSKGSTFTKFLGGIGTAAKFIGTRTNIFVTAASLAIDLIGNLTKTEEKGEEVIDTLDRLSESQRRLGEYASQDIGKLLSLKSTIENVNISYRERKLAIDELRKLEPEYFKNLRDEEILVGNVGKAYENVIAKMIAKAKVKVFEENVNEEIEKIVPLQKQIEELLKTNKAEIQISNSGIPGFPRYSYAATDEYNLNQLIRSERIGLSDNTNSYVGKNSDQPTLKKIPEQELRELLSKYELILDSLLKMLAFRLEGELELQKYEHKSAPHGVPLDKNAPEPSKDKDEDIGPAQKITPNKAKELPVKPDTSVAAGDKKVPAAGASNLEKFIFGDTANIQDPEQRRRQEIKKSISAYTSLVDTAVQAYQTITEAQIKALDKEIEIRRKRVDAATKLAERGNTEALRIEEERLAAAEKKRDEYAKRQAIINSALAVSNAIVAVAEAAAQSGVGAIVTVPAVIAAIVAGYAAISAATKESGSFKDGVVDFQGKGSGTSDSNVVRISHGESVITAAGTQRNKEVLEAINRGAVFNMLQPSIKPMYIPAATQGMGGYASRGELKGLEKKMDTLIDTVAANGTTVHARMDERGMSLMTVKQIRREHNRFK